VYDPSSCEIGYNDNINNFSSFGNTLSSVASGNWTNGTTLTIPANSQFKVSCYVSTNYSPSFSAGMQSQLFILFSISLYTSSRYYCLALGNPTSTNCFITALCRLTNSTGTPISNNSTCDIMDFFDLSSDSSTSVSICFYPVTWDGSSINSLT